MSDIDGFKELEISLSNQYRGQQSHSQYMPPLCQSTQRPLSVASDSKTKQRPTLNAINEEPKLGCDESPGTPMQRGERYISHKYLCVHAVLAF